jgi:hypothetical protein
MVVEEVVIPEYLRQASQYMDVVVVAVAVAGVLSPLAVGSTLEQPRISSFSQASLNTDSRLATTLSRSCSDPVYRRNGSR